MEDVIPISKERLVATGKLDRAKAERDRFVGFAFCWADLLVELDRDGLVSFAFGPVERMLGVPANQVKGRKLLDLIHAEDRVYGDSLLALAADSGRIDNAVLRLDAGNGTMPLAVSGYRLPDLDGRYFLAFRRALLHATADHGSDRNPDTGLLETESFGRAIEDVLSRGVDPETKISLVELQDIDELNKRLGERGRRHLSSAIGAYLRGHSVDGDTAGMLGDGRFSLMHGGSLDMPKMQEELKALTSRLDPSGQGTQIGTASVSAEDSGATPQDFANGLVYALNRFRTDQGGDFSVANLSSNLSDIVSRASDTVLSFRQIMSSRDFEVAFQPIVGVWDKKLHHYEALVRFNKDKPGVSPYETISFAEETGLIPQFDLAMAGKVVERLYKTPLNSGLSVAVNISGRSVASPLYSEGLLKLLEDNLWTRGRLLFEITESSRIDDLAAANDFIQTLRQQGYKVCLDDFGAGSANFQYMSALEVDVVKFDGPVIKQAQAGHKGRSFFKALVNLCRELGVETIAEMIDSDAGLEFIRDCGVDLAQGYLFGKPGTDLKAAK